ncbi:MAG: DUF3846 domain-containing protein [Bacteroidales bacterium]|jgi:hypothetical protein|nr:DUF3846 domain-containing protein [Bacteroidales bacterium]
MATIYYTTGATSEVAPKNSKNFSLEEMQSIVGGLIELVYLDNGKIMVINEEGKLIDLPINVDATEMVFGDMPWDDVIIGDVLVCNNKQIR